MGFLGFSGAGVLLTACGAPGQQGASRPAAEPTNGAGDFSERFASFEVADEPNGDLSQVVWPDFVTQAGAEVKQLYEFQITHGELMRWMPCFCGCGQSDGHRSNRDCYVQAVKTDGSVVLDAMAPT
jgi:hypothetical protein